MPIPPRHFLRALFVIVVKSFCVAASPLQLEYFQSLFDRPTAPITDFLAPQVAITSDLRRICTEFVDQNAYHVVDSDAVFGYVDLLKSPASSR